MKAKARRNEPEYEPEHEPTVWEWLRSVLRFRPIPIPEPKAAPSGPPRRAPRAEPERPKEGRGYPTVTPRQLRIPVAVLLALIAQRSLEQRSAELGVSVGLYLLAGALLGWAVWAGDIPFEQPEASGVPAMPIRPRLIFLLPAAILAALTFQASRDNQFRASTLVFWAGTLICLMLSFWEGELSFKDLWTRLVAWLRHPRLTLRLDGWALLVLAVFALALYFRVTYLASVPNEMVSDHAEKLLDVNDVLEGDHRIFFPRNTGREAIQFYLSAAIARLFGTGLTFLTLKIGMVLAGLLTLPYIYLLGRELGGRKVGLAAVLLAGVAYWPNIISRIALRFALYPLFVAPALYYLARGLRLRRRNDLLLSGLAIGLGLHGYSPARMIPILVALGLGLYLLHRVASGQRRAIFGWLVAAAAVAFVVFIPLLRAATEMPELFLFRTLTRVGDLEQALPGPPLQIFLSNLWNALRMFAWDDGEVWVISIPHRPVVDWVTGAFFHLGVAALFVRYLHKRHWLDLMLLLSIPVLMLPSIISLAFPGENPGLNRAAGAIVPTYIIAAFALVAVAQWAGGALRGRVARGAAYSFLLILAAVAVVSNYRLVFIDYATQYRLGTLNTSEAGSVVRGFVEMGGSYETAHLVGYPYWMDSRLVAINAGDPAYDPAIFPEQMDALVGEGRAQLFILNLEDAAGAQRLRELFPQGRLSRYVSATEGKDFLIYFVPAARDLEPLPSSPG